MDIVQLAGADDVKSAGNTIAHAGNTMAHAGAAMIGAGSTMGEAANTIRAALEAHQTFMDNWLEKFIIARNTHE